MTIPRVAAWTTAAALAAVTVGGVAYSASADSGATASPTSAPSGTAGKQPRGGLLRHLEHGQLTVRVGGRDVVRDVQRGTVSAVSPSSVSVTSLDGFRATYAVDGSTKVRKNRAAASIGDVHDGDHVQVVATAGRALRVADRSPATPGS
jgi:hypothetical protein